VYNIKLLQSLQCWSWSYWNVYSCWLSVTTHTWSWWNGHLQTGAGDEES